MEWALDDGGLLYENAHDATTLSSIDLEKKSLAFPIGSSRAFEARRKQSLNARQRSFATAHFHEQSGAASDESVSLSEIAAQCCCVKKLAEAKLVEHNWQASRVVAVVEWESSAKVDPL